MLNRLHLMPIPGDSASSVREFEESACLSQIIVLCVRFTGSNTAHLLLFEQRMRL